MGFDDPAASVSYRIQSGPQGQTGQPVAAVLLIDDKARHSPHPVRAVLAAVIDDRKLVAGPILTPSDGLAMRVDENSVRASLVDELFFVLMIDDRHLRPGPELSSGELPSPLKEHAPAMIPAVAVREEPLEIGPGCVR
jgi:hypothetical protein